MNRIETWKIHESHRGYFGYTLYQEMLNNKDIILLTGDLGFKLFDAHREDFPDQFINCGASEQAMMGIAVGLAMQGKIPVVYSITPFLVFRAYETIRNYIANEQLNIKLIGSGIDDDYKHDGFSHYAGDIAQHFYDTQTKQDGVFPIKFYCPNTKEKVPDLTKKLLNEKVPSLLVLRR